MSKLGFCEDRHFGFDEDQQRQFDSWTKEQIYEAYLAENRARINLNKEVNKLRRKIAEIKHIMKRALSDD